MSKTHVFSFSILLTILTAGAGSSESGLERLLPGAPERKDMLDAARTQSARDLGMGDPSEVIFTVTRSEDGPQFCRSGDWALLSATAGQIDDGRWSPIAQACGEADLTSVFLLHKQTDQWQVLRGGSLCATDVFWLAWPYDAEIGQSIPDNLLNCFGTYE